MRVLGLALFLLASSVNAHIPDGDFVWGNGEGYIIKRYIGKGDQGHIVLVERLRDGRMYALKLSTGLEHRSIVETYRVDLVQQRLGQGNSEGGTVGVDQYGWYTVFGKRYPKDGVTLFGVLMPFVPSENLFHYSRSGEGSLSLETWQIREIAFQLLQIVEANAQVGLVHQDIKPDNILVRWRNVFGPNFQDDLILHLADTGLAAPVRGATEGFDGTLRYSAPEKINEAPFFAQPISDVFSVGITVASLLLQRIPYLYMRQPEFSGFEEFKVDGLHAKVLKAIEEKMEGALEGEREDLLFLKELFLATTQFSIADRLKRLEQLNKTYSIFRRPWNANLFFEEGPVIAVQRAESKSPDTGQSYGLGCLAQLASHLERRPRRFGVSLPTLRYRP